MIKYLIKATTRNLLKILWILPVNKNKVFFSSFMGKSISCNPYYIFKELSERNNHFTFIWCCNNPENYERVQNENVSFVKINSFKYIIALMTSGILINNASFPTWIPFRMKKQTVINTWHGGGAYKKVAASELQSKAMKKRVEQSAKDTTYFISSSKMFTEVMAPSTFLPKEKFLNIGMPRNDIFFNKEKYETAKNRVFENFKISNKYVVLFAPTYRGLSFSTCEYDSHLDVKKLKTAIYERFGKDAFVIFRGHYFGDNSDISNYDADGSSYPDMQELLCASDMLITDYSSSMWDFSLTNKPCLLFATDLEKYKKERGFYTEPETWGFPIAENNEELYKKIIDFDQSLYFNNIQANHEYFRSYEKGNACQQICNLILKGDF